MSHLFLWFGWCQNLNLIYTEPNYLMKRKPINNTAKELEKLEKNREERRIRNAESREEKKSLMKRDPGNANWEFSAMIK